MAMAADGGGCGVELKLRWVKNSVFGSDGGSPSFARVRPKPHAPSV
jgi:hypothetical protein